MRTKVDKGEKGSILADILRTSFMDDPYAALSIRLKGQDALLKSPSLVRR